MVFNSGNQNLGRSIADWRINHDNMGSGKNEERLEVVGVFSLSMKNYGSCLQKDNCDIQDE